MLGLCSVGVDQIVMPWHQKKKDVGSVARAVYEEEDACHRSLLTIVAEEGRGIY